MSDEMYVNMSQNRIQTQCSAVALFASLTSISHLETLSNNLEKGTAKLGIFFYMVFYFSKMSVSLDRYWYYIKMWAKRCYTRTVTSERKKLKRSKHARVLAARQAPSLKKWRKFCWSCKQKMGTQRENVRDTQLTDKNRWQKCQIPQVCDTKRLRTYYALPIFTAQYVVLF